MGVTLNTFSHSVIFPIYQNYQNTFIQFNITFIFDKCHHSWAVETPDKYECDLKHLTNIFAKSTFPIMKKLSKEL